jgi:hypothetical protein
MSARPAQLRALLCACLSLGAACASDDEPGDECGTPAVAAPLFGASTDPFELEAREQNAVVALTVSVEDSGAGLCTGVLISPRRVLTARHCARLLPDRVRAFIGPSVEAHTFESAVLGFESHDELDLAVADLETPVPADLATPLEPISKRERLEVGMLATLVGYGLSEDERAGTRLFLQEPIKEIQADAVVVDGGGQTGACLGDSGGPLLMRDAEGRHRIIGVLSAGSASCVELDLYQRLEGARPLLQLPDDCPPDR